MKVGIIAIPNQKGQIVIPKDIRDTLGIEPGVPLNLVVRGSGVYLYPIKEVTTMGEGESSYLALLEKTKGSWRGDDWEKTRRRRRATELAASKRRKQAW